MLVVSPTSISNSLPVVHHRLLSLEIIIIRLRNNFHLSRPNFSFLQTTFVNVLCLIKRRHEHSGRRYNQSAILLAGQFT